jgi:hypothetical protein
MLFILNVDTSLILNPIVKRKFQTQIRMEIPLRG